MTVVSEQEPDAELPERWSAKAKTDVVLRLVRGESVDAVSREIQVPAHELEAWRRTFLESGADGLKRRHGDPETRLLKQAQAKVGDLAMRLELAEMLLEKKGYGEELARLKKSRGY
jgi:transposase